MARRLNKNRVRQRDCRLTRVVTGYAPVPDSEKAREASRPAGTTRNYFSPSSSDGHVCPQHPRQAAARGGRRVLGCEASGAADPILRDVTNEQAFNGMLSFSGAHAAQSYGGDMAMDGMDAEGGAGSDPSHAWGGESARRMLHSGQSSPRTRLAAVDASRKFSSFRCFPRHDLRGILGTGDAVRLLVRRAAQSGGHLRLSGPGEHPPGWRFRSERTRVQRPHERIALRTRHVHDGQRMRSPPDADLDLPLERDGRDCRGHGVCSLRTSERHARDGRRGEWLPLRPERVRLHLRLGGIGLMRCSVRELDSPMYNYLTATYGRPSLLQ